MAKDNNRIPTWNLSGNSVTNAVKLGMISAELGTQYMRLSNKPDMTLEGVVLLINLEINILRRVRDYYVAYPAKIVTG